MRLLFQEYVDQLLKKREAYRRDIEFHLSPEQFERLDSGREGAADVTAGFTAWVQMGGLLICR